MDYRLVKQFSNNAVDNFFNFFYKIVDFGQVLVDVFWAFMDIWYHFFMIFINGWLYLYYLLLFILDKLSVSGFFSHKSSSRGFKPGANAYVHDAFVPHNPMFGRPEIISVPKITLAPKASGRAKAVAASTPISRPTPPSGRKLSLANDVAEPVHRAFSRFFLGIKKFFLRFFEILSFKLRPVREEEKPGGGLIDEYMQEYRRKKK